MTWRKLHARAEVDIRDPQAFATCDRCGIQYNLEDLTWQLDFRGKQLMNLRLLVCSRCTDRPAAFTQPVILPPDPDPVFNARPEYSIDDE